MSTMPEKTQEENCRAVGQEKFNGLLLVGTETIDPMDQYLYQTSEWTTKKRPTQIIE